MIPAYLIISNIMVQVFQILNHFDKVLSLFSHAINREKQTDYHFSSICRTEGVCTSI